MSLNEDIASARRKFMTDKIDEQDYRSFKQECEKEIQRLENALFKISSQAPKIDSLLKLAH